MKRHAYVAMPLAKTHGIHPDCRRSLDRARVMLAGLGIDMSIDHWHGEAVHTARNMHVALFIRNPAFTDFVQIDSDIGFPEHALLRLLTHPVEFVAVPYRMPSDPERYVINHLGGVPRPPDPATGLMEVDSLGLGFSRMTRAALERMIDRYSHRKYKPEYASGLDAWSLFTNEFVNGGDHGEDMLFCRRWRDIGGQVWIDPEVKLAHSGPKMYEGSYGEFLRTRPALAPGAAGDLMRAVDHGGDVLKASQAFLSVAKPVTAAEEPPAPPVEGVALAAGDRVLLADETGADRAIVVEGEVLPPAPPAIPDGLPPAIREQVERIDALLATLPQISPIAAAEEQAA